DYGADGLGAFFDRLSTGTVTRDDTLRHLAWRQSAQPQHSLAVYQNFYFDEGFFAGWSIGTGWRFDAYASATFDGKRPRRQHRFDARITYRHDFSAWALRLDFIAKDL